MLSKPAVKSLGIPLELALWVPPAIGATGGIGIGAVLGQWSVGVPAGGVLLAAVGIAVSFTGARLPPGPLPCRRCSCGGSGHLRSAVGESA